MKRTQIAMALTLALALILSACGGSDTPDLSQVEAINTSAAATAIISISQTAAAMPATSTPEPPSATPTEEPPTPTQAAASTTAEGPSPTPGSIFSPTPGLPPVIGAPPTVTPGGNSGSCTYSASFETETVPDGTQHPFGKAFTKTWRVKNTGTCTWDGSVNLMWIGSETDGQPSEELMGAEAVTAIITQSVPPGEYLEVSVNLVTPSKVGTYRVYFKFRSANAIFGIGGNGNLWVEIYAYDPAIGPKP